MAEMNRERGLNRVLIKNQVRKLLGHTNGGPIDERLFSQAFDEAFRAARTYEEVYAATARILREPGTTEAKNVAIRAMLRKRGVND